MATVRRTAAKRKIGVHVSLDLEALGKLDEEADRLALTRSELLRRMIDEWTERQAEAHWLEHHAERALAEERIPWEQAKAELGV
jgi:hypothetical protein